MSAQIGRLWYGYGEASGLRPVSIKNRSTKQHKNDDVLQGVLRFAC